MPRIRRASGGRAGGLSCCAAAAARLDPGSWRPAMRRVISLWLPNFATDRWRRRHGGPPEGVPLVLFTSDGNRQVLDAVDAAAAELGLRRGVTLAQARATVPGLVAQPAEPEADADALGRLA